MLLVGQFFLQLCVALFSNGECLHGCSPTLSFIIQLLVTGIGYLLKPESGLDNKELASYHAQISFGIKEDLVFP